jgi:hypothetical protein
MIKRYYGKATVLSAKRSVGLGPITPKVGRCYNSYSSVRSRVVELLRANVRTLRNSRSVAGGNRQGTAQQTCDEIVTSHFVRQTAETTTV